ncbi:MAG: hypothetical protein ACI376_04020 [Candidatus Bruticola sp.]
MIKKLSLGLIAGACILSLSASQALAEDYLNRSVLKKHGIGAEYAHTALASFSHRGDFIYFVQNTDPESVRDGIFNEIVVVPIQNGKFVESEIKHFPLGHPVTTVDYCMLTPDQKEMIIVSRSGATFARLDMKTGETKTLHEHEAGKPGFRACPEILYCVNGKMFLKGYFYDGEDFADVDCTATFDPSQNGVLAFDRVYDIELQEVKLKPRNEVFTNVDCSFYAAKDQKTGNMKVYVWNPPSFKEPTQIDECKEFISFWGASNRMVYAIQKSNNLYQLALYDANTKTKTIIIDDSPFPYKNVFLSSDGSTVLCTDTQNRVNRATYFYADKSTGWKLTPTADLGTKTVRFGPTRFADDGSYFVVYSDRGLDLYRTK